MDNLKEELGFTLEILIKSGFYSEDEILEIIDEQFIEEDLILHELDISLINRSNKNFNKLNDVFIDLIKNGILAIHNCGYDLEEGIADVFELFHHLKNNHLNPKGFCFYSFEDIEEAILEKTLFLTFSNFQDNDALDIGQKIVDVLKKYDFNVTWDNSINEFIKINYFKWDKSYDNKSYELEDVYDLFKKFHN